MSQSVSRTSLQNLLDLDVVGAEAAVELEVVGVVEEGASQGEEQLLEIERRGVEEGGECECECECGGHTDCAWTRQHTREE